MIARFLILLQMLLFSALPVSAVEPGEILSDPALEKRARDISLGLRCLVCQNQSIDDSNAPLAKDLRLLVRERLVKGDTDAQVIEFVVQRYGEFVLLNPRLTTQTWLLWLGTPLLLLLAVVLLFMSYRRRSSPGGKSSPKPLTASEKRELKKILKEN